MLRVSRLLATSLEILVTISDPELAVFRILNPVWLGPTLSALLQKSMHLNYQYSVQSLLLREVHVLHVVYSANIKQQPVA